MDRYIAEERESIMQEVALKTEETMERILERIEEETSEIKVIVCNQDNLVQRMLDVDRRALRIILHREIERIYESGLPTKTLTSKQRRHLYTLYERYGEVEGNGYITNIVEEMRTWKTVG